MLLLTFNDNTTLWIGTGTVHMGGSVALIISFVPGKIKVQLYTKKSLGFFSDQLTRLTSNLLHICHRCIHCGIECDGEEEDWLL